jgi:hypothetical protein
MDGMEVGNGGSGVGGRGEGRSLKNTHVRQPSVPVCQLLLQRADIATATVA